MINVNQITSQLAKMPDQALQQYASMHKNDPYTVSLALAESNRRKEMRAGAMAGGQQPPTVVDQDISEMTPPAQQLPEDVGIGQLPAPNIEGMAGGGIVAFDEGGEVPAYAAGDLVELPGGLGIYGQGSFGQQPGDAALQDRINRIQANPRMAASDKAALIAQARAEAGMPKAPAAPVVGANQSAAETTRLAAPTPITSAGPAPTPALTTPAAAAQPPAATPGLPGLGGGYEKRFTDMLGKNEVSKEDRMKEFADIEKPAIDKMQAMIDTQKEKLSTDKEQDFYMSLIQGGLAAAGASGPNALQNIAQGFEKGASNYNAALKDLRKAAQENSKMEMELARYESTGKKDALKAFYDHQDKVQGYKAQGIAQIMGHEISAGATMAAAGAPGQQERMLTRLGGTGGLEAGMRKYSELMGTEAKGAAAMAAKYTPQDIMMLEASSNPQDKMLAQQIRSYQQSMMLQPMNKPSGAVRP